MSAIAATASATAGRPMNDVAGSGGASTRGAAGVAGVTSAVFGRAPVEHQVAGVDDEPQPLAEREHGVALVERVYEQRQPTEQTQVPEQFGDHHAPFPLRHQPLHDEARSERELPAEADDVPVEG